MNILEKYSYQYLFCWYFALTAVFACLDMLSIHFFEYTYLIDLALVVLGFSYFSHNRATPLDVFVLFTILLIAITGYIENPYRDLFTNGIYSELLPMAAFFIGKDCTKADDHVLRLGVYAVLVTSIIGIYLYFTQPGWYLSFRLSKFDNVTDYTFLEMTRLSSFWEYPYWISFGVAIVYAYVLGQFIIEKKKNKYTIPVLVFFAIVSILTQQRISIGAIILVTLFYVMYDNHISNKSIIRILVYSLALSCSIALIIFFLLNYINVTRMEFILSKFINLQDSGASGFLKERADLFDNMKSLSVSLLGDGLGLYSHSAVSKGLAHYVTDQGYMKMLYETGFIGLGMRLIIIFLSLKHGFMSLRTYHFECLVIIVILISLTGANSLSSMQMHNIVFWYCCGRIGNKYKNAKKNICYERKKSYSYTSSSVLSISGK